MYLNKDLLRDRTFIIAEAGVNHNGDLHLAKKLVDAAADAKVDAIKFQTFRADKLVTKKAEKAEYQKQNTKTNESQYEMLKKLELTYEDHLELYNYCEKKGIMFISTPFDIDSVDLLEKLGVKMYKLGSGDLTNKPLLKYVASKNKPIILSTGMASLAEVEEAVKWIQQEGNNQIILLHCTSNYPTSYKDVNLKAMETMRQAFKLPVGYSDHTIGIEVSIAAVAMGACVIEKHFTLDKEMKGPDHRASLEPEELKQMVSSIRNIELSMGDGIKRCTPNEENVKKVARKSIVAVKYIEKGEVITEDKIAIKRPEYGIKPKYIDEIIGYKAVQSIKEDTPITWNMIRKEDA
ncbi:N-acetylneuraminate synthase [Caloranaerobacter ferrireducens]|uniref:N-acetylneuraminate synthase n=1 Tax=Caloranaerobacter ferrireducens TaxID=1323370 RepID=UPI00084DE304|nr:N-acetylneuraminate synthase [Caloranaerobacter ferrireducens]